MSYFRRGPDPTSTSIEPLGGFCRQVYPLVSRLSILERESYGAAGGMVGTEGNAARNSLTWRASRLSRLSR